MSKLKTKKSLAKRFKLTKSGKIKRMHAFKSHLLSKKSSRRKRRLSKEDLVNKEDREKIRKFLPYL